LLSLLHSDPDEDWSREGPGGRHVTSAWLRERLRHLLHPEGSQRENAFGPRGYAFRQFAEALTRYIGPRLPEEPVSDSSIGPDSSGSSGSSGSTFKKPRKTAEKSEPDGLDASGSKPDDPAQPHVHPAHAQPAEKTEEKSADGASEPDEPDALGEVCEDSVGEIAADSLGNGAEKRRKPRATRKKDRNVTVGNGATAPDLGLPASPIPPYEPETWDAALIDEVRRLHEENPKRSIVWLARRTGQPKSLVTALLAAAGSTK
jgi:hypothetical protein